MGPAGFEYGIAVSDGTAAIVVPVELNVRFDVLTEFLDQAICLQRSGNAHRIGDAHPIDTQLVHGGVHPHEVFFVAAEGVLATEADFQSPVFDVTHDILGRVDNLFDVLAVAELPQVGRSTEQNVNAIHTAVDGHFGIFHVTARMCQQFGFKPQFGQAAGISQTLWGG